MYSAETGQRIWAQLASGRSVVSRRFLALGEQRLYTLEAGDRLITRDLANGAVLYDTAMENDALAHVPDECIAVVKVQGKEVLVTLAPGEVNHPPSVMGFTNIYNYNGLQVVRPEDGRMQQRINGGQNWSTELKIVPSYVTEGAFAVMTDILFEDRFLFKNEHYAPNANGLIEHITTDVVEIERALLEDSDHAGIPEIDPFRNIYVHMVDFHSQPAIFSLIHDPDPIDTTDNSGLEIEAGLEVNRWFRGEYSGRLITLPPWNTRSSHRRQFYARERPWQAGLCFGGRDSLLMEYSNAGGTLWNRYLFDFAFRRPVNVEDQVRVPPYVQEL